MTGDEALSLHAAFPRQPGSSENVGPFINVVSWILLITSTLAVLTRLITKRALSRRIDVDDAFVVAALIASIGSGIAISLQTAHGLGRDVDALEKTQIVAYQKSQYANSLLYIATLTFAKLSIISLLMNITASEMHRNLGIGLTGFIALWGVASEFVAAFQCGADEAWRFLDPRGTCIDLVSFWRAMGIINMLTDLALIMFPIHVIVTLQMSLAKKVTIVVFFGARSLDIIATAVQMAYLAGFASQNPTRDLWKWTLLTQIIECITILTSCVPYLRPLLESLPSGMYGSDEIRRRGTPSELGYSRNKSGSYQLSSNASKTGKELPRSRKSHSEGGFKRFLPMLSQEKTTHQNSASGIPGGPRRPDGEMDVEITAMNNRKGEDKKWETDSTGSHSKILKTTVLSTEWEEAVRKSRDKDLSDDEIEVMK